MQTNDPSDVCGDAFAVRASVDIEAANYSTPFADDVVDSLVVSIFSLIWGNARRGDRWTEMHGESKIISFIFIS